MKRVLMVLILFNFSLCLSAQVTNWIHSWGGNKDDAFSSIAIDHGENFVVAGITNSYGFGTTNLLVQKYDNTGNLSWFTTWGGNISDVASSVAVDKKNNIYVVGSTSSFGAGWYDVLILKFDSNGFLMWSKTWGSSSYDAGYGISIDSDDNLLISAESYSFGRSAILLKFDANGNYIWGKAWKSSVSYDAAYSLTTDLSGNIILTGVSWDYSKSPNVNKILIVKYDRNGNLLWCRNWGSSGLDEAWGSRVIKTDGSGNVYIAGRTLSGNGGADALLLKLDANGELIWSKNWGGKEYDTNNGIDLDDQGNIYTIGYTKSFTNNQSNLFLLKYDTSGNLYSRKIWNNNHDSQGQSILINRDNIYVTGISYNSSGNWNDINGTIGNPNGSLSTPSNSITSLTNVSKNINGQMTSPTGIVDLGGGNSDALIMSLSTLAQASFLEFPLKDYTPYNAPIVSVFDHSGHRYCPNDTIVDFIGEVATVMDLDEPPAENNCGYLYSYKKNDGTKFLASVTNYVGTLSTGPTTLNYDGHPGYDYKVPIGTDVTAAADGKIVWANWENSSNPKYGLGMYIKIQHLDGEYYSTYGHLSELLVNNGDHVKRGQLIGKSGNTGSSTGSHLHFEIKNKNNISIDPYGWKGNYPDPYTFFNRVVNVNLWLITNSSDNFVFNNFSSINDFTLVGSAMQYQNKIRLTTNDIWQAGAMWYNKKQFITKGFETIFNFEITNQTSISLGEGADGIAFLIQNDNSSAIGDYGGAIGYGHHSNVDGISNSIAIEFDTWQNPESNDPNDNHISINTRGLSPNDQNHIYSFGSYILTNNISDDKVHTAKITYLNKYLKVFIDNLTMPLVTIPLSLEDILNLDNGKAWIGFTSSTGLATENHDIINWSFSNNITTSVTKNEENIPNNYLLYQNYPNPFNPSTTIKFSIPNSQFVTLKVYDLLGREVSILVNEEKLPGNYEVKFDGSNLPSGVYFYRLQAGSFSQTKKLMLMK